MKIKKIVDILRVRRVSIPDITNEEFRELKKGNTVEVKESTFDYLMDLKGLKGKPLFEVVETSTPQKDDEKFYDKSAFLNKGKEIKENGK